MKVQFEDGKAQMNGQEVIYNMDNDVVQIGDYDYEANETWTEQNNDSMDSVVARYDLIDYNVNDAIDSVYVRFIDGELESISDSMDDYEDKIKIDRDENGDTESITFHTDDGKEIVVKADLETGNGEKLFGTTVTIDGKPAAIYNFDPVTYEFNAVVAEKDGKTSSYEFRRDNEDKFYLPKSIEYKGEEIDTDGANKDWTQKAKEEFEAEYKPETGSQVDTDYEELKTEGKVAFDDGKKEEEHVKAGKVEAGEDNKQVEVRDEGKPTETGKPEVGENDKSIEIGEHTEGKVGITDTDSKTGTQTTADENADTTEKQTTIDESDGGKEGQIKTGNNKVENTGRVDTQEKTEEKNELPESLKEKASDELKAEYKELKEKIEAFEKKPELFRTDTDKANLMKDVASFITRNFDTSEIRSMVMDKKDELMNNNEKRYKDENVKVSTSESGRERYYDVYKKDNDGNSVIDRREVWDEKEKYISRVENYREDARLDSVDYMNKAGQNYLTVNYGEKDVEGTPYEKVESVIERQFSSDEKDARLKSETEYGKGYKETTFFRMDGKTDKVMYLENPNSSNGFGYVGKESYDKDGKVIKSEFNTDKMEKLIGDMEKGSGISLGFEDRAKLENITSGKSEDVLKDLKGVCNGFDASGNGVGISNDKVEYAKMITSVIDKMSETLRGVSGEKLPPREVQKREDILQKLDFLRNNIFETKDNGKTYVEKFEKTRDVLETGIEKGIKEFNEVLSETKEWMQENNPDVAKSGSSNVEAGQIGSDGTDKESQATMTMEKAISNYLDRIENIKDNDAKADDSKYQGVKAAYDKYMEAKDQYNSNKEYVKDLGLMENRDFFVQFDKLKLAIAERNLYMEAKANPDIAKEMGTLGFKDNGGYLRNIFTAALAVNNSNVIDAIVMRGVIRILDGLDPLTKTSVFEKEEKPEVMTKGDVLNTVMTDMANLDKDEYEKFEKDVSDTEKPEDKQGDIEKDSEQMEKPEEDKTELEEKNMQVEKEEPEDKDAEVEKSEDDKVEEKEEEEKDKVEQSEDDKDIEKSGDDKTEIEEDDKKVEKTEDDEKIEEDNKTEVEREDGDKVENENEDKAEVDENSEKVENENSDNVESEGNEGKVEAGNEDSKSEGQTEKPEEQEEKDNVSVTKDEDKENQDKESLADKEKEDFNKESDSVEKETDKDGETETKDFETDEKKEEDDIPDYVEGEEDNVDEEEQSGDVEAEADSDDEPDEKEIINIPEEDENKNDDIDEEGSDSDAESLYKEVKKDDEEDDNKEKIEVEEKQNENEPPDIKEPLEKNEDGDEKESGEVSNEEDGSVPEVTVDEKENDSDINEKNETDSESEDVAKDKVEDDEPDNEVAEVSDESGQSEEAEDEDKTGVGTEVDNEPSDENSDGVEDENVERQMPEVETDGERDGVEEEKPEGNSEITEGNKGDDISNNDTSNNDTSSGDTSDVAELNTVEIPETLSEMIKDYINTDGKENDNCVEFSDILSEIKDNGFDLSEDFVSIFTSIFLENISDGDVSAGDGIFSLVSHASEESGVSFLGLSDQIAEALGEHGDAFYDSLSEGISLEYARPDEDSKDMAFSFGDMEYRIEMDGDNVDNVLTVDTSVDADGVWGYPTDIGMDTFADTIHDICADAVGLEFADNVLGVAESMVEMSNGNVDMDTALQMVVNDAASDVLAFGDAAMDENMYQQLGMEILQYENVDIPENDIMDTEPKVNDTEINYEDNNNSDVGRDDDSWND